MYKSNSIRIDELSEIDNIKFLRKLQENVTKLDKLEQYEIFKIIKTYNNKLTENKNGIFINLSSLERDCIIKINNFITYSLDNRKRLDNMEVLSQNILKNSILNNEYKSYDVSKSQNKNENSLNLKSRNDKNKDTKNKDISMNKNNMVDHQLMLNLEITDDNINLEREYSLYEQNLENDPDSDNYNSDVNIRGIINQYKENVDKDDKPENKEEVIVSKKNKFTGKRGRIFKKCKENSKNINLNSIVSYNNYSESQVQEEDDEEYPNRINELTEDTLE